jgi:AmmeMemoRadiSam system protein B/AmmeMemoRadiSam system protein A
MFYPGDPEALRCELEGYLSAAGAPAKAAGAGASAAHAGAGAGAGGAGPKMLVVPHAGYMYSGPVAARGYALLGALRGRIERVVLLGPTHRVAVRGLAAPTVAAFDTPLGDVPLDRAAIDSLADLPQVRANDLAHAQEHSLEVQLPFLQAVLGRFALVPLAVGQASPAEVAEVLERLWGGDETLVIISTDLSHYLPYADARAQDSATVARILAFDRTIDHDGACGATPLNGALRVAKAHGLQPRLLDLRNSGDTAGDRSRVVGYCAIAFDAAPNSSAASASETDEVAVVHAREDVRKDARADPAVGAQRSFQIPGEKADDRLGAALLSRARNSIASLLGMPAIDEPAHPALARPGATFVTLLRKGELRGCIGRLEAAGHTLDEDVRSNAHQAAFEYPRFPPLQVHEWPEIEVEVSLLGPLEPLRAGSEPEAMRMLRRCRDGVIFEWRGHRSTFLPQVWEQLPDPGEFLAALRRKAGLPGDFWHEEVRIQRYELRKFAAPEVPA